MKKDGLRPVFFCLSAMRNRRYRAEARRYVFARTSLGHLLRKSEEDAKVAEVVAGRAGEDGVVEAVEEIVRVAAGEEIGRREAELFCASERVAVGDGAGGVRIAVNAVGTGAENRDGLTGDFFNAGENKGGVAAADSLPRDFAAEFTVSDKSDALARILTAEIGELSEKVVGGAIERPIIGGVVAAGEEAFGFGGVMGGVKEIVGREQQRELRIVKSGMHELGSFRRSCGEETGESRGQLMEEIVLLQNAACVCDGGGIRDGWAGSEGGFFAEWDI